MPKEERKKKQLLEMVKEGAKILYTDERKNNKMNE